MSRLIVIGGGIGGLAVALSAAASGNEVVVLERAREFAEIGAGIQLAPNGLHALKLLGVGDRVAGIGVQVDSLRLFDATVDRLINTMSLGVDYQHRFNSPYLVVHRAELHRILVDACAADERIELRSRSEVIGYQQDALGARAQLADGSSLGVTGSSAPTASIPPSGARCLPTANREYPGSRCIAPRCPSNRSMRACDPTRLPGGPDRDVTW